MYRNSILALPWYTSVRVKLVPWADAPMDRILAPNKAARLFFMTAVHPASWPKREHQAYDSRPLLA